MVTLVKHEWHQVDSQFALELDESLLSEIYPDLDEDEIAEKLQQIENGEISVDEIVDDAYEEGVDLDWDRQYDDFWTDRKGGYDVTYELGDEDSWHHEPQPDPPYHKCTKCRWEGSKWQGRTAYVREDGSVIPDDSDEEHHSHKEVCPMCDSDLKLTEFGEKEFKEYEERRKRWAEEDETEDLEPDVLDMEEALQELKDEFEKLMEDAGDPVPVLMKCVDCGWQGDWTETNERTVDDIELDTCPQCGGDVEEVEDES